MTLYQIVGCSPKGKRVEIVAEYAEEDWQFALKLMVRLKKRGYKKLVMRELLVTHETK